MTLLLTFLITINLITFLAFAIDKLKAKRNSWRIPEAHLLLLCFLGGSLGGVLAMQIFRHKTRHVKFALGVPLICLFQLGLALYFFY